MVYSLCTGSALDYLSSKFVYLKHTVLLNSVQIIPIDWKRETHYKSLLLLLTVIYRIKMLA